MHRLDRLLRPRSIAVIGGGFWGSNVVEQCRKIGFTGDLWPVHPSRDSIADVRAVPRVEDLPAAPDAVFIGINRDKTIDAVHCLAQMGAGGAICFASGFGEAQAETGDGNAKQTAVCEAAGDMPILGPNCYGFLNYLDNVALWPDQHGGKQVDRGVGLILQSSNIAINLTMQRRGLPLAYVCTVGNQAQTGLSEIARAMLQDDRVTALGLHIEGIDDLRAFEAMAAEAHRLGKPIVALKIGKSVQAQTATVSHTASLSGSNAGARALLKRVGIGQVDSVAELLETLKLLHTVGPLSSYRIASLSCSGGEASLMADTAHRSGLEFPALTEVQAKDLRATLGPSVALANPLDYHTHIWGDVPAMTATFTAMMQADLGLGCLVLDLPRSDRCDPSAWEPVIEAVAQTQEATERPMAVLSSLPETLPETIAEHLFSQGIAPLCGLPEAVVAMRVAADIGQAQVQAAPVLSPQPSGPSRTMSEAESKSTLVTFGVPIPEARYAGSPKEAATAASALGFPVALKGEGVAHKTEHGAVVLDLADADAVEAAARAMPCNRFLVEQMVTGPVVELLVGVTSDPPHGCVLTLGAGGTLTELLDDTTSLLVPAPRDDVHAALHRLKLAPRLSGYRRAPGVNLEALLDAIMAVQAYTEAARPYEVEINPLLCGPERAVAVDALIRIGDPND